MYLGDEMDTILPPSSPTLPTRSAPVTVGISPPVSPLHKSNGWKRPLRRRGKDDNNEFLRSCRRGDYSRISQILDEEPDIDVNFTDSLGRSALRLAVKYDHLEIVEELLGRSNPINVHEALLLSISLDHDHISEVILRHPVYQKVQEQAKSGADTSRIKVLEGQYGFTPDDTLFASDVTPLVLAAQRNQLEIVRILLEMGERIEETHNFDCTCPKCRGSATFDELRFAKTRLNTYKGLTSEAYLSLSSSDPILTSFQLAHKLRSLGHIEKYFKAEYLKLADNLSEYVNKLLDKVRDGDELGAVLDAQEGISTEVPGHLARLKLAVHFSEKKFVGHPSCQKKLTSIWYGDLRALEQAPMSLYILFALGLTIIYPFLAILYWIYPWGKIGKFLRTPLIKFVSSACSYIFFICMIIAYSVTEEAASGYTISNHSGMGPRYRYYNTQCRAMTNNMTKCIEDENVRYHRIGLETIVLSVWIIGLVWQSGKKLYTDKFTYFFTSWYNIADMFMFALYIASFTLRYICMFKVQFAIEHLSQNQWTPMLNSTVEETKEIHKSLYWIMADRNKWNADDMFLISEALFAVANIFSVCRLTYLFAVNDRMGPLLITLTKMIMDVFSFMFIFLLIIAAFVVGFHNLLWYYQPHMKSRAARTLNMKDDSQISTSEILWLVYWSIFGMVELQQSDFIFTTFEQKITRIVSNIMFAVYNWIIVIVLINMLIAMMARSYEIIAEDEDIEWKFVRSKLYLEYIKAAGTLCVPFNIVPTWKLMYYWCKTIFCCCRSSKKENVAERTGNDATRKVYRPMPHVFESAKPSETRPAKAKHPIKGVGDSLVLPQFIVDHMKPISPNEMVMSRVLKRHLAQGTHKRNDSNDKVGDTGNTDELKKDLSNFRYEVVSAFRREDIERREMKEKLIHLENSFHKTIEPTRTYETIKRTEETKNVEQLFSELKNMENIMKQMLTKYNEITENFTSEGHLSISKMVDKYDNFKLKIDLIASKVETLILGINDFKNNVQLSTDVRNETVFESGRKASPNFGDKLFIHESITPRPFHVQNIRLRGGLRSVTMEDVVEKRPHIFF